VASAARVVLVVAGGMVEVVVIEAMVVAGSEVVVEEVAGEQASRATNSNAVAGADRRMEAAYGAYPLST
jgi:hypothetical protein